MSKSRRWIGQGVLRGDAPAKVQGTLRYNTDLTFPGMLYAQAVRSPYPHAIIKGLDISRAQSLKGVVKVLTAQDVPGVNGYGIVIHDQPVLCSDKVRFRGEPVALVIAHSQALAAKGAQLVAVDYEPLPVADDVLLAMQNLPAQVHSAGNVHLHTRVGNGVDKRVWEYAALVVENTYSTARQIPGYLEPEAGVGLLDETGNIVVYCGAHYPNRDCRQIARALGVPEDKVRVISTAVGGGFGGKDEVTLQIQLALAAWHTGRPVKIVHTREESFLTGLKKHPMLIKMKTAADSNGLLLAQQVEIYADTGAYASLGGPIVNLAVEHVCGVYRVPNLAVDGYCIYTNNGVSGAMRGFGVNQVTFAMETQMDLLARGLGLDRAEIRRRNILKTGDLAPLGNAVKGALGTFAVLEAATASPEWQEAKVWKQRTTSAWRKRGVGLALAIQGCGLGKGLPDFSVAEITCLPGGRFRVAVGNPEVGQGNTTALAQIAAEALGCDLNQVELINGDTGLCPDSGSATASRSIYASGNAIIDAARQLQRCLKESGTDKDQIIKASGYFHFPIAEKGVAGAFGLPHYIFSAMGHVALVEVDILTGQVEVEQVVAVPDAGTVINLQGLEGQCEGGTVMGLGYALLEDCLMQDGRVLTANLSTYLMPTSLDSPPIRTMPVESVPEPTGPYGAKGIGETVCVPITPAITSAILDAIGVAVTELPATPEKVYRLLHPDLPANDKAK